MADPSPGVSSPPRTVRHEAPNSPAAVHAAPLRRGDGADAAPVAIVTVNYNSAAFIEAFLDSLRRVRSPRFHLIVVDCASRDGSVEVIARRWPEATLIRSAENIGFTGGNNVAIREALARGFPYLLFLNNDTIVDPRFLDQLLARADGRTLVVPRVELAGTGGLMDDTAGEFDWRRGVWRNWVYGRLCPPELQHEREVSMASLCCLLAPAALFRHAGMLDERLFMYYEDFDFVRRARSAGYRVRYVPDAVVFHHKSASSGGDSPFKVYYATRNRVAIMRRHSTLPGFMRFSADFALTRLVRAGGYLAGGRRDLAGAMLRGWLDAYRGRMGRTFAPPVPPRSGS